MDLTISSDWVSITAATEEAKDPVIHRLVSGTADLYNIEAMDKARAVPYVKIQHVNRDTNEPIGNALSNAFFRAPRFGQTMNDQFGERPSISLDNVTVKSVNPGGWILYREIDLELTVHRLPALHVTSGSGSPLGNLIVPGATFYMHYGWVGGSNPILGPGKRHRLAGTTVISDTEAEQNSQTGNGSTNANQKIVPDYPARRAVRFTVTHYNFTIQPDGQAKFHVHGIEDAELQIRSANIFNQGDDFPVPPADLSKADEYLKTIAKYFTDKLVAVAKVREIQVPPKAADNKSQPLMKHEYFIQLRDVLNILLAEPIVKGLVQLKFNRKNITLYTGVFNKAAPETNESYGVIQGAPVKWADQPIGEFWMKYVDVQNILNGIIVSNGAITVYNVLRQIMSSISDPSVWKDLNADIQVSVPEIQLFTEFDPDSGSAYIFMVDRKRYLTRTVAGINEYNVGQFKRNATKRSFLKGAKIPDLKFYQKNSFFKSAQFEVVNDEQMKSIFIQKQLKPTRDQTATQNQGALLTTQGVRGALLLYRSAIKGSITMIGNFVYDMLGLVWITFGVPQLDGIFYVIQRVDTLSRDGFDTTITFQAEGSDPLGVGTLSNTPAAVSPTDITRNQSPSAPDRIREMILLQIIKEGNAKAAAAQYAIIDPNKPLGAPGNTVNTDSNQPGSGQ